MSTTSRGRRVLRFGVFALDRSARTLHRNGERLTIQELPLKLLEALLLADNRVVTYDDLAEVLWPDRAFVDRESGIHTAVRKVRGALADSAGRPRFIETVPRVGYRFLESVSAEPEASILGRRSRMRALAVAAGVLAVISLSLTLRFEPEPSSAVLPAEGRQAFREARFLLDGPGESLPEAVALLRSTVSASPDFAPGHGLLSEALVRQALELACAACPEEARRAAERALEIDGDQVDALMALSKLDLLFSWDADEAARSARRALELAPDSAYAHLTWAVWLAATERHDAAVEAAIRAMDLEPTAFTVKADLGNFLLAAGRPLEAARACERLAELDPSVLYAERCSLLAHTRLGDFGRAARHARRLLEVGGVSKSTLAELESLAPYVVLQRYWRLQLDRALESEVAASPLRLACFFAMVGDEEQSLAHLEAAFEQRVALLALLPMFPEFDPLRGDARFEELVAKIGVASESAPLLGA